MKQQIVLASSIPLNRASVEETEFDLSPYCWWFTKIQTADNVIGVSQQEAMRERGRYLIPTYEKTRHVVELELKLTWHLI